MDIESRLILPQEVLVVPVAKLARDVRASLDCGDDDFAVSGPNARIPSTVIDADTAGLLNRFRQPRTLTEAVILYSLPRRLDPQEVLSGVWPLITRFYQLGLLRNEDAEPPTTLGLGPGDDIDGRTVLAALQVMEDSELHQVRRPDGLVTVVKLQRLEARTSVGSLAWEATVLEHLGGQVAPALLARGNFRKAPYLELEWCLGIDPVTAGAEWRARRDEASRAQLLELCTAVSQAYADLHELGVLHTDVHPRNVLVAADGTIRLVDFGLAVRSNQVEPPPRHAGMAFYYEPEHAQAVLAGSYAPVTAVGEQFAVAALLYQIVAGHYYYDFDIERERMLRQIVDGEPLAFTARGLEPWPDLETVLRHALAKAPSERFASMADLVTALTAVKTHRRGGAAPAPAVARVAAPVPPELVTGLLGQAAADGPWLLEDLPSPRASIFYGAAGVAHALYRIACQTDDPRLLELADVWACHAARELRRGETALYDTEMEITHELIGNVSPYHCSSGLFTVQAQVAHARGDVVSLEEAVGAFLQATTAPGDELDLTLGAAGPLLACAWLLDLLAPGSEAHLRLSKHGGQLLDALWPQLLSQPAPGLASSSSLGMAHGWAGKLYAILQWCRASGRTPPEGVEVRLEQLRTLGRPVGRGLRWPCRIPEQTSWSASAETEEMSMAGWCHGSAGFVFLWSLAARVLERSDFDDLAEAAAWDTWHHSENVANLCCGLAGRAYALLHIHRRSGENAWLRRAEDLARRSVAAPFDPQRPHSLFKGALILPVLAADLERPENAVFPFFEEEGWRS